MDLGERIEQAVTRANARGVNLVLGRPIPAYEDYEPHTSAPRRRDVQFADGMLKSIGIPGLYSAGGRQTRSSVNTSISRQEFDFVGRQMDQLELAALLWCLNEDALVRPMLKGQLLVHAVELKEIHQWPKRIRRADCELTGLVRCPHRYVIDLCTLALKEGADPDAFGTEIARALYFGVSERHWRRSVLAAGYQSISARLTNWLNNGLADLGRRLVARAA